MIISNQKFASSITHATAAIKQQVFTQHKKGQKTKTMQKIATTSSYVGVFLLIITMVAIGYQPPEKVTTTVAAVTETPVSSSTGELSVDEIVANSVAGGIAERANMPIARSVAERSVSLAVKRELAQTDETVISKPKIIQPGAEDRSIETYVAKAGDTVQEVGDKFGVSATTVRWANDLTSDALDEGKKLKIPPVNGVIYTIDSGDTVASIAKKYSVNKERIIAYNDLEITGPKKGMKLILPGAKLPETERPGYEAPQPTTTWNGTGTSSSYGATRNVLASAGNRYAPGYCTWYVYERRAAAGRPIGSFWGNAVSWAASARAAGFTVNNTPTPGSIMQNGGGYGHVAYVERVDANGVHIREMNGAGGWGVISSRTISMGQATSGGYRFIH